MTIRAYEKTAAMIADGVAVTLRVQHSVCTDCEYVPEYPRHEHAHFYVSTTLEWQDSGPDIYLRIGGEGWAL